MKIIVLEEETRQKGKVVFGGKGAHNIDKAFELMKSYQASDNKSETLDDIIYLLLTYFKDNGNPRPFKDLYNRLCVEEKPMGSPYLTEHLKERLTINKKLIEDFTTGDDKQSKIKAREILKERGFIGQRRLYNV